MAEVQRWTTALWLPGMRAGLGRAAGEETGCEWERQRSYSGTTALPCDCGSTRTQIRLYGTCICVEMASNYAQIVQTLLL